jgi:hypothetical protein
VSIYSQSINERTRNVTAVYTDAFPCRFGTPATGYKGYNPGFREQIGEQYKYNKSPEAHNTFGSSARFFLQNNGMGAYAQPSGNGKAAGPKNFMKSVPVLRPPSEIGRGKTLPGYTGFQTNRPDFVGKTFGTMSRTVRMAPAPMNYGYGTTYRVKGSNVILGM